MRLPRLLKILFLLLFVSVYVQAQSFSTSFSGGDENPISESGAWAQGTGYTIYGMQVLSGTVRTQNTAAWNVGNMIYQTALTRTNGRRIKVTVSQFGAFGTWGISMRLTGLGFANTGYFLTGNQNSTTSTTFTLESSNAAHPRIWGGQSTIDAQTTTRTVANGDSIIVQCLGDAAGTMYVYHNTTLILTGTDVTYNASASTPAYYGLFSMTTQTTETLLDDFSIDTITVPTPADVDTVPPVVRSYALSPATVDTGTSASFIVSLYDTLTPSTGLDSIQVDTNDVAYWKYKFGTTKDTTVTSPTVKFGAGVKTYRVRAVDDSSNVTTTASKSFTVTDGTTDSGNTSAYPLIAYLAAHAAPQLFPNEIDYSLVTHIIWGAYKPSLTSPYFAPVVSAADSSYAVNGLNQGYGNIEQWLVDSAHANGVKVLLGLDGVGGADIAAFATIFNDSTMTQTFVDALLGWMTRHNLDGVDINWEWPAETPAGQNQMARYVRILRRGMTTRGLTPLLTSPSYVPGGGKTNRWEAMQDVIDSLTYIMPEWYNMAFQATLGVGYSSALSRPILPSGIYSTAVWSDSIWAGNFIAPKGLVGLGWPKRKILLGCGMEGYGWARSGATPIQLNDNNLNSAWPETWGNGNFRLQANYGSGAIADPNLYPRQWDDSGRVPFKKWYDGANSHFYTYDDSLSFAFKGQWIRDNGYGGAMTWELSGGYISPRTNYGGTPNYSGDRWATLRGLRIALGSDTLIPPPPPPTLLTPTNGGTGVAYLNTPFSWNTSTGATSYQLVVAPTSSFNTIVVNITTTDTSYQTPVTLGQNTTYYWKVRATAPSTGQYSGFYSFTTTQAAVDTPLAPTLASPANAATDQSSSTVLTWSKNSSDTVNISSWGVQVATDTNMTLLVTNISTWSDTAYSLYNLSGGTKYYWRVRANNLSVSGPYSGIRSFTVVTAPAILGYRTSLNWDPALKNGTGQWTNDPQPYTYERKTNLGELPSSASIPAPLVVRFYNGYSDSTGTYTFSTSSGGQTITNAEVVSKFDGQANTLTSRHTFNGGITVGTSAPVTGLLKKIKIGATSKTDSVNLIAGTNITLTPSNDTITISAASGGTMTRQQIVDSLSTAADTLKEDVIIQDDGTDKARLSLNRNATVQSYFRNNEAGNSYWESGTSSLFLRNQVSGAYLKQSATSGSYTFYLPAIGTQLKLSYNRSTYNDTLFAVYDSAATTPSATIGSKGSLGLGSGGAGSDAFTTTAETDTVTITGAAATDLYFITLTGTAAPSANDAITVESTATGFVLHRAASGTSGLTYNWLRIRNLP